MRPFRFAVQTTTAASARQWRDLARKVEDLGYSTLFLADHYIGPGPVSDRTFLRPQHLAPLAAIAAAAAWTTTLRVGCRVFCVDYHVPAALAKEAATIDLLSGGRLEIGVGAGTNAGEYEAIGLTFEDAPRRVSRLEEVIALIKAHSAGGPIALDGAHVRVGGYSGLPAPVQRPHPPIMIGGSRRRVLSLAAREADIVSMATLPWVPVDDAGRTPAQEAERRLRMVRDAAGERFGALELESSPYVLEVTDAAGDALERWAARLRTAVPGVRAETLRDHPNVLAGSVEHIVERLRERRETLGVSYITVPRNRIDAFAPVVERLTGT
ncbi:TIGR03621 family F420-dependent LLM class oxidoreductase [Actinomadura sp. WMMB 499]|uniref:TIGR03621 family F420-dependent LLM class oxidoreductase n=1 Tax=Actinomadura sp. WMMB 499 TaxID=1219491 RepID=UPI001244548C|nr:TIGR03621 family F420-dependent LLM class oxidoreductase [Actinomadura sp. WMMB 499]QFG22263.1 TIGR03621 family F420-dependent LLM class oxidoreductase [Actinomadura sp. WMMB 499]